MKNFISKEEAKVIIKVLEKELSTLFDSEPEYYKDYYPDGNEQNEHMEYK
jgi:hypothetical protein